MKITIAVGLLVLWVNLARAAGDEPYLEWLETEKVRERFPTFTKLPRENVTFKCNAKGRPKPVYSWYKIHNSGEETHLSANVKANLQLYNLSWRDTGVYRCIVHNEANLTLKWETQLNIAGNEHPPVFVQPAAHNYTVKYGGDLNISCSVIDMAYTVGLTTLPPRIVFLENTQSTNGTIIQKVIKDSSFTIPFEPDNLQLRNITEPMWLTCRATNIYGPNQKNCWITVKQQSPVPSPISEKSPSTLVVWMVAGLVSILIIVIIITLVCVVVMRCRHVGKQPRLNLNNENPLYSQLPTGEFYIAADPAWEIDRDKLTFGHLLGEGCFGQVFEAELVGQGLVAVKLLRADRDMNDFVNEMKMMKSIGRHPSLINLLGCCTQERPYLLLLEYAAKGNLRDLLKTQRMGANALLHNARVQIVRKNLYQFSLQVAQGMQYLSDRRVIHRDLAARNVLVTEELHAKISDYGLSKNLKADADYYRKLSDGRLPVKWMAPEALLDRKYSTKSDVWSFGILLWEMFTWGGTPYPSVPIEQLLHLLEEGHRMQKPDTASLEMYHLMLRCWLWDFNQRPEFITIIEQLDKMLCKLPEVDYLDMMPEPPENLTRSSLSNSLPALPSSSHYDHPRMPPLPLPNTSAHGSNTSSNDSVFKSNPSSYKGTLPLKIGSRRAIDSGIYSCTEDQRL